MEQKRAFTQNKKFVTFNKKKIATRKQLSNDRNIKFHDLTWKLYGWVLLVRSKETFYIHLNKKNKCEPKEKKKCKSLDYYPGKSQDPFNLQPMAI